MAAPVSGDRDGQYFRRGKVAGDGRVPQGLEYSRQVLQEARSGSKTCGHTIADNETTVEGSEIGDAGGEAGRHSAEVVDDDERVMRVQHARV